MFVLAAGYDRIAALPATASIRQGILAAVVALLVITMERLARPLMTSLLPIALGVTAFLVVLLLNISAVWAVVGAGIVGIMSDRRS
jgi:chromate transport protein ChrA